MKAYIILAIVCMVGCQNNSDQHNRQTVNEIPLSTLELPKVEVGYGDLKLNKQKGHWTLDGTLYSGYATEVYPNNSVKARTGFFNGKKQGIKSEYFPDGHLKQVSFYHQNLMHGEVKNWSGAYGHPMLAIRNYFMGKPHGEHRKWYKNGQVFKIMNYNMGKEEGIQQAFNENGSVYANYEAKNGRIFGLKRSMLCYELEDEKIKTYESQ